MKLVYKLIIIWLLAFLIGCTSQPIPKPEIQTGIVLRSSVVNEEHGYDAIGLAKYCDRYLKAPRLPKLSFLLRSFGDPLPCADKALDRGGLTKIQYVLRDATCWRNKKCPSGTPSLTDWNDIKKLALQVNKRAVAHPEVKHEISPYLEHDFKDAKIIQKACSVSLAACPTCTCINEPFSGTKNTGYPLELHGTKVTAWSVSGDGASMFDGDNIQNDGNKFQHRLAGEDSTYAWWDALNLRCQGMKEFVPINKRTARPTSDQFWQAYKILVSSEDPVPSAPSMCKSVITVSGKEILKPNAEKYCNPETNDKRGDKPLLIIKKAGKKGDKIKVFNSQGKEVGCFKYYGPFSEKPLHRWYMGDCSGQAPYELYKALGSEWGFTPIGGGVCLRFNALRRMGIYR